MNSYHISFLPLNYGKRCAVHPDYFQMSRDTLRASVTRLRSEGCKSIRVTVYRSRI